MAHRHLPHPECLKTQHHRVRSTDTHTHTHTVHTLIVITYAHTWRTHLQLSHELRQLLLELGAHRVELEALEGFALLGCCRPGRAGNQGRLNQTMQSVKICFGSTQDGA
eukprot:1139462-Pelagomonas_calceolata.AAC.3